jgi:hypothetical protein
MKGLEIRKTNLYTNRSLLVRELGSSFGIAAAYGQDDRVVGIRVPVGSRILNS